MSDLRVEVCRGELVESVHTVHAAVVDAGGRLLARSGDPGLATFWRSAAKPFQAMPLVLDGAADRFRLSEIELALCCASHSSEPIHLDTAAAILRKLELPEAALACGPHPPLGPARADEVLRDHLTPTPLWSNCSGKHAGMLALARHHGWPIEGYHEAGHPVQERILDELAAWTGLRRGAITLAVDGCNTVCYALPLAAMALAYARFGSSSEPAPTRLRQAMMRHPLIVAGHGRPCTRMMDAWAGRLVAKIGAEGVYSAALPEAGLGIAVKVEDGDTRSVVPALLAVLQRLGERGLAGPVPDRAFEAVLDLLEQPVVNTRGVTTGVMRVAGSPVFI